MILDPALPPPVRAVSRAVPSTGARAEVPAT